MMMSAQTSKLDYGCGAIHVLKEAKCAVSAAPNPGRCLQGTSPAAGHASSSVSSSQLARETSAVAWGRLVKFAARYSVIGADLDGKRTSTTTTD